jgi:transcriptional regulator with XRE-family HTH domain
MTRFKILLESRGIKQNWIAAQLEVSEQIVSAWAKGERTPSKMNLGKLAKLLRLSNAEVFNIFFDENVGTAVGEQHTA